MEKPHYVIARKAALRLAENTDPSLPQRVEAVLAQGGEERPPDQYDAGAVIGLAGLVVSIASFVYAIYLKMKESSSEPPKQEAMARRVRVQFSEHQRISPEERDRIIDIVVEETFTYGK